MNLGIRGAHIFKPIAGNILVLTLNPDDLYMFLLLIQLLRINPVFLKNGLVWMMTP